MKKYLLALLVLSLITILPAKSYALVDAEIFGGYTFDGEVSGDNATGEDLSGPNYGFRAHFNNTIVLFDVGLGGFVQYSKLSFDISGSDQDVTRTSKGFDGYIKLNLPAIPLKPYVRAGWIIHDKTEFEDSTETEWNTGLYYGAGVAFSVLPLPVLSVQIYGEYIYNKGDVSNDSEVVSHTINIGALASI